MVLFYSHCFNSHIKPYLIPTNQTFLQISCQFLTERAIPYLDFSGCVSFSDQNFTQAKLKTFHSSLRLLDICSQIMAGCSTADWTAEHLERPGHTLMKIGSNPVSHFLYISRA